MRAACSEAPTEQATPSDWTGAPGRGSSRGLWLREELSKPGGITSPDCVPCPVRTLELCRENRTQRTLTRDSPARTGPVRRRHFLRSAGAVAGTGLLAGCTDLLGGGVTTGTDEPIRIGASLPFTGFLAEEGVEMYLGMEYWRRNLNEDGGLLGRPVEFVIHDDRGT